jgi:glucokinase
MILAADVGGTKIHAALFERTASGLAKRSERLLGTADVGSPAAALAAFVRDEGRPIEACAIGVAGPVLGDRVVGANLPWELGCSEVSEALGGVPVRLLNDLEASGHGLDALAPDELETLQAGRPDARGPRALVSPGTGLGETILVPDGRGFRPIPGEGGHADFAPRTDEEVDLLRWLRGVWGRVSAERVVSGPGLVNVFLWLRDSGRIADDSGIEARAGDSAPAARIARAALERSSSICGEALRIWVGAFGAEAGNVALRGLATGGVFLGGGIPARILPALRDGPFLPAFRAKEPQERILVAIPVRVVVNPETTLLGAAIVAAGLAGQEG